MRRAPPAQPAAAVLLALSLLLRLVHAGSMGPGVPENITVTFLNPTTVRVSWSTTAELVEKYDVTYKPSDASYRVVLEVAGNSDAVILSGLEADTQYQVTVAALWGGHKYRSRPIVFRTLEPPRTSPQQDGASGATPRSSAAPPDPSPTFPTIRGVEIGIVVLVLLVWVGAIALFFNRWGKIRMLLPYQPDYKQEQLKVPGSSALAAAAAGGTCGVHSAPSACSHLRWSHTHTQSLECEEHLLARCNRPRVNSAIFVSAEPTGFAGFDAGEFLRRHGSQSKLCRKARSADNIPLTTIMSDSSERLCIAKPREDTINEEFSKSDDSGSIETHLRWSHTHTQSLECEEHLLARCNRPRVNSAIFVSAEPTGFAGFDAGEFLRRHGSQSKLCRKARSADNIPLTTIMSDSSERLCIAKPREDTINEEFSKSDDSGSIETVRHFGLPILSVSGPSPPDEDYDQIDEYL